MANELLDYLEYKGSELIWKKSPARSVKVGDKVGSFNKHGYREFSLKGSRYYCHRVVWFLNTGTFPDLEIDHIDGDKSNNLFENLREVSREENMRNTNSHKDSISKYKGVSFEKQKGLWRARCFCKGKSYCGGFYEREEEAAKRYDELAKTLFGEYAKLNFQGGNHGTNVR